MSFSSLNCTKCVSPRGICINNEWIIFYGMVPMALLILAQAFFFLLTRDPMRRGRQPLPWNHFFTVQTDRTAKYALQAILIPSFKTSLTNSRGSRARVQSRGRGSNVAVAGPKSRSRVQCRGRGSKVAVAGPKLRSRVQCRGRGSNVAVAGPKSRSRVQCRGRGKLFGVRGN